MASKPRLGVRLIYYAFCLIIVVAILEIGVRLFEQIGPKTFVFKKFDPVLGVSLIPNREGIHRNCFDGYVSINSHGMRDGPRQIEKKPGTYRIGLFGDSVIEGVHVRRQQVSTKRLEVKLNRNGEKGSWEVLNFSIGGMGTLHQYLRYMRDARKFDLDLVVVFMTPNDLSNNMPGNTYDANLYGSPEIVITGKSSHKIKYPKKPRAYGLIKTMSEYSAFFRFSYKLYYHYIYARFIRTQDVNRKAEEYAPGFPISISQLDSANSVGKEMWFTTEYILNLFAKEVRKDGKEMVLVYYGYNIYDPSEEFKSFVRKYEKKTGHKIDFRTGAKRLSAWARRNQVKLFNFGEYLHKYQKREGLDKRGLSYSCDGHFNPEGHNVIAEFLYSSIVSGNFRGK